MKKLLDLKNLTHTAEYFSKVNSKFSNWVIGIIGIFVSIFLVWIFFGRCEEVVSGSGSVRPSGNISFVHSPSTGKIFKLYFKDGQSIKKGDLLFTLYSEIDEASRKNTLEKIKILEEKILDNELMIKSFNANKNLISLDKIVPHNRIKNFFEVQVQLLELSQLYKKNFIMQSSLPPDLIKTESLNELERVWRNSEIQLSQYTEKFLSELILEKENYTLQLDNYKTNLSHLNNLIESKTVLAPIDGTILSLENVNENDFISLGQKILSIIPSSSQGYEIIVRVRERDVTNIKPGLHAKVKLPAYSKLFKNLNAKVKTISADSLSNGSDIFYLLTLELEKDNNSKIKDLEKEIKLKSGLQANAKIIVAEQSILSYIINKLEINL